MTGLLITDFEKSSNNYDNSQNGTWCFLVKCDDYYNQLKTFISATQNGKQLENKFMNWQKVC